MSVWIDQELVDDVKYTIRVKFHMYLKYQV